MSCLSKVFNSISNTRLQKYLDKNKIIIKCQIGFKPKARTSDLMFVLIILIQNYKLNYLYRLSQIDIKAPFYYVIKSIYTSNNLHIRIGNKLTRCFTHELN